ncbi:MAG: GNAT family N-acetyltransferase [Chloroflexi bacterium]|nr:GNAT family N-acetyltransferase [Chloroflexota bacterium]
MIYRHDEFPCHLNWQAVSFIRAVWPWINNGLLRETYGAHLRPVHFALVLEDLLISYAAVIEMTIGHTGETVRLFGLGNVFTYPSFRKQGYGSQVVTAATQYIQSSAADVAALFCEPNLAGFYAKAGWQEIHGVTIFTGKGGLPTASAATRMMLFVSEKGRSGRGAFESAPLSLQHGW